MREGGHVGNKVPWFFEHTPSPVAKLQTEAEEMQAECRAQAVEFLQDAIRGNSRYTENDLGGNDER